MTTQNNVTKNQKLISALASNPEDLKGFVEKAQKVMQENKSLREENSKLEEEKADLEQWSADLAEADALLRKERDDWKSKHDKLKKDKEAYEKLQSKYDTLKAENEKLQGKYDTLKAENEKFKALNAKGSGTTSTTSATGPNDAGSIGKEGKYTGITFTDIQQEVGRRTGTMLPEVQNPGKDHIEVRYFCVVASANATNVEKYFSKDENELELELGTRYPHSTYNIRKGYMWVNEHGVPTDQLKGYELESCQKLRP